ncbi:MAG TPA: M20/M25/M40 family metallo-hydrolase [Kofleriaceae bacterium]|nr:M20/M25/M40 family metallo-hydrolase [Kofleriaceae bacterium]
MPPPAASAVADLLADLIAFRTHHAPTGGAAGAGDELALCRHLAPLLAARGADEVQVVETGRRAGGPGGYVYARWGRPRLLINSHLDTVPANTGWTRDPWTAEITADRVYGLGAADTKGAIAAALTALERTTPRDVAVLFSGDEERGTAAVEHFLASPARAGLERAIVCEPTARTAGTRHRGVLSYRARVAGAGGHSSNADHMPAPIVTMARLAVALHGLGVEHRLAGPPDMQGLCMNVATLDGGVAFNVVPDGATLGWSIRPWPGFDRAAWEARQAEAARAAEDGAPIVIEPQVEHAPFGCDDAVLAGLVAGHARERVALQFWTEAALYQEAGIAAIVIGPGDIAQAHAPDEWVTRADLDWAVDLFTRVLEASRGS